MAPKKDKRFKPLTWKSFYAPLATSNKRRRGLSREQMMAQAAAQFDQYNRR